jgi:NAD(P)-dependent dehydrogenase (short-subunit alcohol dehydrogenase family)
MDIPETDFTPTIHRTLYPAITPTRQELSQAGKTVLITGGGTGVGKATARSFVLASAANIIIIGRRFDVLQKAVAELEKDAAAAKSPAKIIARQCDVTKHSDVTAVWDSLKTQSITVDVLVLNSAKFSEPLRLFELGIEDVWSQFEANVKGPLHFAERFYHQQGQAQKVCYLISITKT